ncbi:FAD-dependent monooxygenase [Robiginitomaculum antarcticum]|uniref:FAD-dependent monooxygenase n=1 Tax=Robiginitomaculum antarcticum TaxID=437507 RepID=UPI00037D7BA2|nr:FAD-dependent monooxygenase [Robiginitomaculum antarcticum]
MTQDFDIAIVGGGPAGLAAALSLHRLRPELSLAVIDAGHAPVDGRASMLAPSSWRLVENLGLAKALSGKMLDVSDMLISDGVAGEAASPLSLHFSDSDHMRGGVAQPLGHMVQNADLTDALRSAVDASGITQITARVTDSAPGTLTLDNGQTITAGFIAAADGGRSVLRRRAGIETTGWDYLQSGIVTTIAHELPHEGCAQQLFLPSGPLALLPLIGDAEHPHQCSIVWSEDAAAAKAALALPVDLFTAELARRMGDLYGKIETIAPLQSWPLKMQLAKSYHSDKLALVGDAAHIIHPLAGQGLNLGLRDAAALAQSVADGLAVGEILGGPNMLGRYSRWRKSDALQLAAMTDGLEKLFSNRIAPLRHLRRLGLGAVDRSDTLRSFFMREAAGETGDVPGLLV